MLFSSQTCNLPALQWAVRLKDPPLPPQPRRAFLQTCQCILVWWVCSPTVPGKVAGKVAMGAGVAPSFLGDPMWVPMPLSVAQEECKKAEGDDPSLLSLGDIWDAGPWYKEA